MRRLRTLRIVTSFALCYPSGPAFADTFRGAGRARPCREAHACPALAPVQLPFTSKAAAPRRRSRWRWLVRLLPVATLLALAVWFAPAIVAKTELRNRFARQALADVHGSVEVGGASLGWLTPVELRDVVIKDEAGRTIFTAPKITSQKSLFDLSRNKAAPGEFVIENPTLAVVCEKDTTNVEGAFAEYLKPGTDPGPTRTPVALKVTGGTLTITDAGHR